MIEPTSFNDKLDIFKHVAEVHSRIRKDIGSDFVMAKLGEKDKEAIIELTSDAYFCKRIVEKLKEQYKEYNWGTEKYEGLDEETQKKMQDIADQIFDSFMTRIYMTVNLSRNVAKNYLLNLLAKPDPEEEQEEETTQKPDTLTAKAKEMLKDQENEKRM